MKIPKGEKAVQYWRPFYDELSKDKKKKYQEKADREKERYKKKMEEYKNYVFDMPKKPLNAFNLFVKERIPDLKKEHADTPIPKLLKICAKEWTSEDGVSQSKYEKKAEYDKKRFKKQLKDFETLGYYKANYRAERKTKVEDESEEEEEEERKTTKRKRRSSSSSKKSTKRSKSKTRSKSKSKTQDVKRSTKSRKKKKI